jgi:hypothetical protein
MPEVSGQEAEQLLSFGEHRGLGKHACLRKPHLALEPFGDKPVAGVNVDLAKPAAA